MVVVVGAGGTGREGGNVVGTTGRVFSRTGTGRAAFRGTVGVGATGRADKVNMDIADDSTGHKFEPSSLIAGLRDQLPCFWRKVHGL